MPSCTQDNREGECLNDNSNSELFQASSSDYLKQADSIFVHLLRQKFGKSRLWIAWFLKILVTVSIKKRG